MAYFSFFPPTLIAKQLAGQLIAKHFKSMEENIEIFERELNSIIAICDDKIEHYKAYLKSMKRLKALLYHC